MRAFDATETASVTCWSEPKFVSGHIVAGFFAVLAEKFYALFIYAWLLLSVGIHPDRLEKLVQTNSHYIEPGTDVHNNRTTGVLSYFVFRNGNDKDANLDDRDRIPVQLPHFVSKYLAQAGDHPFLGFTKKLNTEAGQFRKMHGGITPTAHALARTFETLVQPYMKDDLLANMITGEMTGGLSASSHYYSVDSIEANTRVQFSQKELVQLIRQQVNAESKLNTVLDEFGFRGTGPYVSIGSRKNIDKQSVEYTVEAIHMDARIALRDAQLSSGIKQVVAYARVVNLLGALLFLIQRYSLMLRTVANRARIYTHPDLKITMTEDKNSGKHPEARANFRVECEHKQCDINTQALATLLKLAEKAGMVIQFDNRLLLESHAVVVDVVVKPKDGIPRLRLSRYTQKRFKKLLRKEGIVNIGADNANRHYIATNLRGKVPQPLLDQALNHKGAGRNPFYDFSFVSLLQEDHAHFTNELEAIFPFRVLDLPLYPWQTTKQVVDISQVLKKATSFTSTQPQVNTSSKRPRKEALPSKPAEITGYPAIIKANDYLWSDGFAEHPPQSLTRIGFVLALCLEQGAGQHYLDNLLPRLTWEDRQEYDDLLVPFTRGEEDSPHTRLFLADTAALLLESMHWHDRPQASDWFFAANEQDSKQRNLAVKSQLKDEWETLKQAFKRFAPQYSLPSLEVVFRVAKLHPILEIGLEPYLSTLLSDCNPTTTHSAHHNEPLFRFDLLRPGHHRSWLTNLGQKIRYIASRLRVRSVSNDFLKEAIGIRDELIEGLDTITAKSRAKKPTLKSSIATSEVHALIDDLLIRADKLNPEGTSALHLALNFIRSRYCYDRYSENIVKKTVSNIFGEAFSERLFAIPEARDLTELTAEALNDYLVDWVDSDRLEDDSALKVANCLRKVLAFGRDGVYFPDIDIPAFGSSSSFNGTRRADLISPFRLDNHIRPLMESNNRNDHEHACTPILAHYGGLRESEIRNLTLDDIVTTDKQCWIYIRYGKSRRARRVIPLHLLAHPELVRFIHDCRTRRYLEFDFEHHRLKQISFLGPQFEARAYERHELSDSVIKQMKSAFGPDADLHLLRHGFASWLAVRMAALRYPQITKDLVHREHWLFKKTTQNRLLDFFSLGTGEISRFNINALIHIARLMGHSSLRTTFTYYVQTFSVLQREAVGRANAHFGKRRINAKTAAALFSGKLSSSRSFAMVKNKTVSGMLLHLLQKKRKHVA